VDYQIPDARVGYQNGFGEFTTYDPQSGSGPYNRRRAMVIAAVKNGLALVAEANGPYLWPKFKKPGQPRVGCQPGDRRRDGVLRQQLQLDGRPAAVTVAMPG
jgi:hypothetical protein